MAGTATTGSAELERRVEERIAQLPPVHMTAMQAMTTIMWRPMALMGLMIVVSGVIIAGINSFNVDEFFGLADPDVDSRASFQSIQTWLPGYQFMGMGMIFAAITMVVASILGRLRILGGTVQSSLDATIVFPPFPMAARAFPMLMLLGLMIFMAQLGISAWLATEAADAARGDAGAALNVAQTADWLQGMRFAGVGIMLAGIALALFTITLVMTFMANRIRQISAEAIEADL